MTAFIEATASFLLSKFKAHDAKSFITRPAITSSPHGKTPTLIVTSPDCGEDGSTLGKEYMFGGEGRVPELRWQVKEGVDGLDVEKVEEWLIVSEDPDAPLPTPICHGIYLGIPKEKTSITNADFQPVAGNDSNSSTKLKGGFWYGANRRSTIYIPPRPLLNHGVHRYFYYVIALSARLDVNLVASKPTREQVDEAIKGKVLGWGQWMGRCERKW